MIFILISSLFKSWQSHTNLASYKIFIHWTGYIILTLPWSLRRPEANIFIQMISIISWVDLAMSVFLYSNEIVPHFWNIDLKIFRRLFLFKKSPICWTHQYWTTFVFVKCFFVFRVFLPWVIFKVHAQYFYIIVYKLNNIGERGEMHILYYR